MSIEEEIKLTAQSATIQDAVAVDPDVLASAQGHPMRSRIFLAVYYDTPDRRLLRHHLAFRLRQEGDLGWRATLKGTGGMVDGLSRRQEWEAQVMAPLQQWGELPPGELREQVLAVVDPADPLASLFVTDFTRRILLLQWGECRVEMALDQGEVRADGRVHPLSEVELERLAGPLAPIQSFADDLIQRYALIPSRLSKFGLGLSLLGLHEEV